MARITEENETMLRRLQEKTSCYNVFEWELDRKKQVKMLKKICYYPPSLVKKTRLRSKRHGKRELDPNYEVYQYYQNNLKPSMILNSEQLDGQRQPTDIEEVEDDDIDQRNNTDEENSVERGRNPFNEASNIYSNNNNNNNSAK